MKDKIFRLFRIGLLDSKTGLPLFKKKDVALCLRRK